jgi:hypothetical protein
MSQFSKKIKKLVGNVDYCLVVGDGFGFLDSIVDLFSTIFIVSEDSREYKNKKIVYVEDYSLLENVPGIRVVFLGKYHLNKIKTLVQLYTKNSPLILIEGSTPIDRLFSEPLYYHGYKCTSVEDQYHVWRKH